MNIELHPDYLKLLKSYYGLIAENISLRFNLTEPVKLEEPMKKETLESPTREQVLKATESCPDAKTALKELYPSVFKEEEEYCCDDFRIVREQGIITKDSVGDWIARYKTSYGSTTYFQWYCPWCGQKLKP